MASTLRPVRGYAALAVPFAYATAALLLGDDGREWVLSAQAGRWRLGAAVPGHRARCLVGLRRAVVGRLLGLGPGREHVARALANGDGARPFAARLPAQRAARRWALGLGLRDLLGHHPRDLDDAHRPDQLGPRLRAERDHDRRADHAARRGGRASVGLLAARWRRFAAAAPARPAPRPSRRPALDVALAVPPPRWPWRPSSCRSPPADLGLDTYRLFAEPLGVAVVAALALCPLLATGGARGRRGGRRCAGRCSWRPWPCPRC